MVKMGLSSPIFVVGALDFYGYVTMEGKKFNEKKSCSGYF
jgi:hypothetical protein